MRDVRPGLVDFAGAMGLGCATFVDASDAEDHLRSLGVPHGRARAALADLARADLARADLAPADLARADLAAGDLSAPPSVVLPIGGRRVFLAREGQSFVVVQCTGASQQRVVMALHELSNAMTVVLGLADSGRDATTVVAEIASVARDGLHVARTVERPGEGDANVGDALAAIRRCVEGLRGLASETQTRLVLHAPELPFDVADDHAMAAIVWNLIKNAIQVSPPGAAVRVEVSCSALLLELVVRDVGPGMPELRDVSGRPSGHGRGVGLQVAADLAEKLDAELRHERNAPRGTVATLRVPAARRPAGARGRPADDWAGKSGIRARHARVLVVEDDALLRGLIADRAEQLGFAVSAAADPRSALAFPLRFDVALVDAHLGSDIPTDELIRGLRSRARFIVAVTGDSSVRLAVDRVVRKPFDLDELLELVDELAGRAQSERSIG